MAKQLQLRRGNLSWWTTNNPVLADGEMVLVSTTNDYVYDQYRIGDGLNTFSSLAIHSFPFNTTIEQFLADAEAARDAAQLAETNAETAKANAEAAEALAEKWATNPENVVVESGKYSALHWSAKAEDEKLAAEVHKNKAQQWAEAAEDTQVEAGKYSAKHYSLKAAAQNTQMGAVYPTAAYNSRVLADSGTIFDLNKLTELYIKNLQLLPNTVFLWSGVSGMKTRTSGSNQFASKLYNMANKVQQFGSELVTNGVFTGADGSTPTGWTAAGSTLTIDTNRLKITNTGASGFAYQAITTVVGKTYHFSFSHQNGSIVGSVRIATTLSGADIYSSDNLNDATLLVRTISFVATTTTTYIRLVASAGVSGDTTFFDNISVKQMDWIEGTNDAVQNTEANQPYVGGVIAPNEVKKLKNLSVSEDRKMSISAIEFADNSSFSISFNCKLLTNTTEQVIIGYAQSSGFSRISILGFGLNIRNRYGGSDIVISNIYTSSEIGKSIQFTIVYNNGVYSLYKNGVYFNSISGTGGALYNQLFVAGNTTLDFVSELIHLQIHNRALSASEIQAQHEFLRLQIPEIEGIAIGNQYWTTSNYEGVVAGDGSVINEVQNADNVEKITDVRDREFSEDTGWWTKQAGWSITSGVMRYDGTGGTSFIRTGNFSITNSKWYKLTLSVISNTAGSGLNTIFLLNQIISSTHLAPGVYEFIFKCTEGTSTSAGLFIYGRSGEVLEIDNVSVQEVGWSQSTALYDAIYAQTSGSAQVKELAALKAAAMWCYYNNDVNNGAIYGKLYNWYAVALLAKYPPTGWRVPSLDDFRQLQSYLGGDAVAGGKMKLSGTSFWSSPNAGGTNESGLSVLPSGIRAETGSFAGIITQVFIASSSISGSSVFRAYMANTASNLYIGVNDIKCGYSIRLLRNEPTGAINKSLTTGDFTTNFQSGTANYDFKIPFGHIVESFVVRSRTGITNLQAIMYTGNASTGLIGTTALETLIAGKTVTASTPITFQALGDQTTQLQDAWIRFNGTKADTTEVVNITVNLKKIENQY